MYAFTPSFFLLMGSSLSIHRSVIQHVHVMDRMEESWSMSIRSHDFVNFLRLSCGVERVFCERLRLCFHWSYMKYIDPECLQSG